MSKSLGNSPDPLDLIAKYGADALRFGVMRSALFLLTIGLRYSLQHFGHVMLVANSRRTGKSFKPSTQSV